jgi:hypothetical protein
MSRWQSRHLQSNMTNKLTVEGLLLTGFQRGLMSKNNHNEKYEKEEEKDEKGRSMQEEKSVEEKWRRDSLGTIVWALILIWAGFVFLASNMGILDVFNDLLASIGLQTAELPFKVPFLRLEAWSLIFAGAGVLLLAEVVIRLLIPSYRKPVLGTAILAVIALGIGLGTWGLILPLVLIIAGLAIILGALFRPK